MSDDSQRPASRPPVWIGHVSLTVSGFDESLAFFELVGMRRIVRRPTLAVLELRGGTHLVLQQDDAAEPTHVSFDLMVDDLSAQHQALADAGFTPGPIQEGRIHSSFEVLEPSGNTVKFNDSHVVGVV